MCITTRLEDRIPIIEHANPQGGAILGQYDLLDCRLRMDLRDGESLHIARNQWFLDNVSRQ